MEAEREKYDAAIIGSGPAGLSAALNLKIRKKKFIIFGNKELSSKLLKAAKIENYLGFPGISGEELKRKFENHIKDAGIEITEDRINNIYAMGSYFALFGNEKEYEADSIILATGVNFGKLLEGENEFLGKGVGYCATCDAALYKGKKVTIIAYNKKEEAEVNFVNSIAAEVCLVPLYKETPEVDDSVKIIYGIPKKIEGSDHAEKLILDNAEIETDGIFILRDSVSPGQLVPGIKIADNHVEVNRLMETNLKGCFAAGDVVGMPYQFIKAAGEGNIAALSATKYIDDLRKNK